MTKTDMTKSKVRCWKIENWRGTSQPDLLFISYPEDNSGHDLVTCLKCGQIYAASVFKQVYVGPPLEQKLIGILCVCCGNELSTTYAKYPDQYLSQNGEIRNFQRAIEMPLDENSLVVEFYEIYS